MRKLTTMKPLADPGVIRSLSFSRVRNIFRVQLSLAYSFLFRKYWLWGKPYILTIEPTNRCNLKCPQCATGSGKISRAPADMTFSTFQKIIDELKNELCYIVLFNQGEPFLNGRLFDFIKYAKRHRMYVISSTNGHFLTEEICRRTIASGLDQLIISLDGTDQQTYGKYRGGGNFKKVVNGIRNIVRIKDEMGARRPVISVQFLVIKHNAHQIPEIREMSRELNVDRLLLKTVQVESNADGCEFVPSNNKLSRYERTGDRFILQNPNRVFCSRLWTSATILSNGAVVPCCFDKNGDFTMGVVNQHNNFTQIWSSEGYEKFRRNFTHRINARRQHTIRICENCTAGQKVYL
ncbi:radical SAM protein [candidate division KSB1 bacterium]|nr:radical SAM protein [candidate division KSB1 bacterium]